MQAQDLKLNDVVIFSKIPNGSYLTENVEYEVTNIHGKTIHFTNVLKGSGTSANVIIMNRTAIWSVKP